MSKINIAFDGKPPQELKEFIMKNRDVFLTGKVHIKLNDMIAEIGLHGIKRLADEIKSETGIHITWMIDGKWKDIPNTVANYAKRLEGLDVAYYTVHASGGPNMIRTAKKAAPDKKLLAITVLTSMEEGEVFEIFDANRTETVLRLAKSALEAGADGLVCSPADAPMLRQVFGDNFLLVTPNIQREGIERNDDQNKALTNTPKGAIENGSSDIVVGRPILSAENPSEVIEEMLGGMSVATRKNFENGDFAFEKVLYTGDWESLLKYIGAIYRRPKDGAYVRLASKLLSDSYINVGATERDYRVLARASDELSDQMQKAGIKSDIVMGAQMGSVRLSEVLARSLSVTQSIYTEKDGDNMKLARHDLGEGGLQGKKVILSEDVITKGSTLEKMIEIVKNGGGEVVAVTCVVNRSGKDNHAGIPLYTCYIPPVFGMWHDDTTPMENRGTTSKVPDDGEKIEKPKNEWNKLVLSMR